MSRISDPVDTALESLRVHGTSHRDTSFQELEIQIMQIDRQRAARRQMLTKLLIAVGILVGGSLGGYAAVNPSIWRGLTFYVESDGTVTDETGKVSGETIKNDDNTFTTTIDFGNGTGIRGTFDEPMNGNTIYVGPQVTIESDDQD